MNTNTNNGGQQIDKSKAIYSQSSLENVGTRQSMLNYSSQVGANLETRTSLYYMGKSDEQNDSQLSLSHLRTPFKQVNKQRPNRNRTTENQYSRGINQ